MTIGESMKKARLDKGYSQTKLSIKSGISVINISQWERNKVFPTIINLIPIADALGVTLDELVGRTVQSDERN